MTSLRLLPFALLASLALVACGSDDSGPGSPGPNDPAGGGPTTTLWTRLQACHLTGDFRVTSAPSSSCEDWPRVDESVSIEGEGDAVFLRAGLARLPVAAGEDECSFVAAGCASTSTTDASDSDRYFAPTIRFRSLLGSLRLDAEAVDVVDRHAGPCEAGAFRATPVVAGSCHPVGTYQASAEASVIDGSCDLTWGDGEVTVSKQEDGYTVDWAGTVVDELTLDQATCTLTGSKGEGSSYWFHNNARRTAKLSLTVTDAGLEGTVEDRLDPATHDGTSCKGGTFALAASRPADREARTLEATCGEPPPPVCGDGVCEQDETCRWCVADCACQAGTACADDSVCRAPCTLATESTVCGQGEHCSPMGKDDLGTIFPSAELYCVPAGPKKEAESCKLTRECGAGLVCHTPASGTQASCRVPCGEGLPGCTDGEICGTQGDGSGAGSYPTAVMACEHRAGPGEDCSVDACKSSLSCIKVCLGSDCSKYCSQSCSSSSSCPDAIPVCESFGYCTSP